MAYVDIDFRTKKALKDAVKAGAKIGVYSSGIGGPYAGRTGVVIGGPHYPKPHTWYATVDVAADGTVAKVRS